MKRNKTFSIGVAFTVVLSIMPIAQAMATTNPYGTPAVDPAGPNEIIFTISKKGKEVNFTYGRLSRLKSGTVTIYEPFLKKSQTFTVIPFKTLFPLVGIAGKDRVVTTALNDYIYTNTASKFLAANALLAIKRGGKEIPYDQGGPVRIIFDNKSSWSKNLDAWNWSLASISVK